MITKTRARNSDLFEFFGVDKLPKSSDIMKQKLIAMAKKKQDRPINKTKEGKCLTNYTVKSSGAYCPKFDKTIRKIAPGWFESTSQIMKAKLIVIAKSGAKKPNCKTKEGQCLSSYICKSSSAYCPKFDKTIRKQRPDWFLSTSQTMKQKLIAMAKKKQDRPTNKTKEGKCLTSYTVKSSGAYCPKFDKTIRGLAPDWFIFTSQVMKQKLIDMAKSDAKRPNCKTKEGQCLSSYICKSSGAYCPKFDKTIRKQRPDWFLSTSQTMKQKLIAMAKSGAKKPHHETKEAKCFYSYTRKSSPVYDADFDKTIRKQRPDWFLSTSQIVDYEIYRVVEF